MAAPPVTTEQWEWLTRGLVAVAGAVLGWIARHTFWKKR